jgi:outer membrane protein OmpA-like peptidoglycan-associated protein/uncharacterized protein YidB (DUF937 family)
MALFDSLVTEVASKFGLGAKAGPLLQELVRFITGQPGGIAGFLDKFKSAGMGNLVASWLGRPDPAPINASQVDQVLGGSVIGNIANKLGLGGSAVSAALGYAIPKVVGLLTPDGTVPSSIPAAVTSFLGGASAGDIRRPAAPPPAKSGGLPKWLIPLLVLLGVLGLAWYLISGREATVPPVTQTAPAVQPRLSMKHEDGVVNFSGTVKDEASRGSIIETLKSVFGAENIKGDITVNPAAAPAAWLANLKAALENLKVPGVHALFEGKSINIGGFIPDADRDRILGSLKSLFGTDFSFGPLIDKVTDAVKGAGTKVLAALSALKPGFGAADVAGVLNLHIINFDTGSAAVPWFNRQVLKTAAAALKQLPAGTVIEIAGYTDNTGDPAANLTLSQQRADAVRAVLIDYGVPAGLLTAKGYGAANPIAPNDTPEGRFQNRRIEYRAIN